MSYVTFNDDQFFFFNIFIKFFLWILIFSSVIIIRTQTIDIFVWNVFSFSRTRFYEYLFRTYTNESIGNSNATNDVCLNLMFKDIIHVVLNQFVLFFGNDLNIVIIFTYVFFSSDIFKINLSFIHFENTREPRYSRLIWKTWFSCTAVYEI